MCLHTTDQPQFTHSDLQRIRRKFPLWQVMYNARGKEDELYQLTYHGYPHRFDKFNLELIGSGERSQAHGYGLYFAADREISGRLR